MVSWSEAEQKKLQKKKRMEKYSEEKLVLKKSDGKPLKCVSLRIVINSMWTSRAILRFSSIYDIKD